MKRTAKMLRHAMQYLLKSNVSIGMIGLLLLSYLFIYSENILDVLKMFTYLFLVDLLKDLALIYAERFYPNLCYKS